MKPIAVARSGPMLGVIFRSRNRPEMAATDAVGPGTSTSNPPPPDEPSKDLLGMVGSKVEAVEKDRAENAQSEAKQ